VKNSMMASAIRYNSGEMNNQPEQAMNTHPAASLLNFRHTLKAWRMHKHNIRIMDETGAAMN
jgi:hypothetical protein